MDHNASIRMGGQIVDLRLISGESYDLQSEDPHIKMLVSTGLLVEVTNNISKK